MLRRALAGPVVRAAVIALGLLAFGALRVEAGVREEIEARYDLLSKAFAARDSAAILALRTPTCCIHFPGGERDSADRARQALVHFLANNLPPIRIRFTIHSLQTPSPDVAVVDVFQQGSRYQMLAGKKRLVEHDVTQRDTWRRVNGVWLLTSIDDIRDRHRWVDSVPVDPSKPYDPEAKPFVPAKP